MMKVVTSQRRTIEKHFPYKIEDLLEYIWEEIDPKATKKELMDFLFRHKIAKYQKGEKFGMLWPIITPYDRFYNNETDLSIYQTGAHCALVITHKNSYLNCYPRFDEYTMDLLVTGEYRDYALALNKDVLDDYNPLEDDDILDRIEWECSKDN